MFSRVQELLFQLMAGKKYLSDREMYRYVTILTITAFTAVVHLVFVLYYLAANCYPLAIFNSFCLLLCAFVFRYQLKKDQYDGMGVFITLEILFVSMITILSIGSHYDFYLHFFVALLVQMSIPFKRKTISPLLTLLTALLLIVDILLDSFYQPPLVMNSLSGILTYINTAVLFFAILLIFSMNHFIQSFLSDYQSKRLSKLQDQVYIDPLTGLYNRRYAEEYFAQIRNAQHPPENICLAIADLDDFKNINDSYGHDAGDEVLRRVSAIMREGTRDADRICRWGGEEFLLVINAKPEDAHRLLDRIRQRISEVEFRHGDSRYSITITIGMTPLGCESLHDCLEACDKKLYTGKNTGKNQVVM